MTLRRPQPGDMIADKYRVEQMLGEGGMGYVIKATHTLLDETVALKFLLPEIAKDAVACERFLREAKAARRIKGPHIADILDVGKLPTGEPFIAMEFLEGFDFHKVLDQRGALPVAMAINTILQACSGLADAHAAGIVHRDLKPSNLFLTEDISGTQIVKILDFGISKLEQEGAPRLTKTTAAMGSALYMSPEQMRSARDADHRSDIYALGITLYELLAARVPYDGTTMTEVVAAVLEGTPHPITEFRKDLPEGLADVVHRAIAKQPAERFSSVEELAAALRPFVEHHAPKPIAPTQLETPALIAPVATHTVPSRTGPSPHTDASLTRTAPESRVGYQPPPRDRTWMFALGAVALFGIVASVTAVQLWSSPESHDAAPGSHTGETRTERTNTDPTAPTASATVSASAAPASSPDVSSDPKPSVPSAEPRSLEPKPRLPTRAPPRLPSRPKPPKDIHDSYD